MDNIYVTTKQLTMYEAIQHYKEYLNKLNKLNK